MTLTTLTESTLKSFEFLGITARAASAARVARNCSDPGCFDARDGAIAVAKSATVGRGDGDNVDATSATAVSEPSQCPEEFRLRM